MRFTCALSTESDLEQACLQAGEHARERHGDLPVDLAAVFAAASYPERMDPVPVLLHELLSPRCLVGCSGGGIIGDGREVEANRAVSVTLATMEGVGLHPIHVGDGDLPDADSAPSAWTAVSALSSASSSVSEFS